MVKLASQAERLSATFSALADPTRRQILESLAARGETPVTRLAEPFDMSLPAVSKHLRVLEQVGLVSRRKEGRIHKMRLEPEALQDASSWIERYERFWNRQLDSLSAYLETEDENGKSRDER